MYPYIIMKLSKKKIQKLYKSKNQTRKSGGKKSFKPKQTNHRSRKAGALNLRRRTLRKMKGGDPEGEEGEPVLEATPVIATPIGDPVKTPEGTPVLQEELVKVPEGGIEFTALRKFTYLIIGNIFNFVSNAFCISTGIGYVSSINFLISSDMTFLSFFIF